MGRLLFQAMAFPRGSRWTVGDRHALAFTERGNLELWQLPELNLLWESDTIDRGVKLAMQGDGNLVIYDKQEQSIWASDTSGHEQHCWPPRMMDALRSTLPISRKRFGNPLPRKPQQKYRPHIRGSGVGLLLQTFIYTRLQPLPSF